MADFKCEKYWKLVEQFITELKTAKYWLRNDGHPLPEWKLFETREDAIGATLGTAWNAAWNAAFSRFSDQPKPAKIDFENQLILLVTMGEKNSGGYSIKIDSIVENEKTIVVTILETSPGKSCITTSMMTYPYQMVELKNSTKEVIFKTIEKFYDCK